MERGSPTRIMFPAIILAWYIKPVILPYFCLRIGSRQVQWWKWFDATRTFGGFSTELANFNYA
jgi:hypothetical protein